MVETKRHWHYLGTKLDGTLLGSSLTASSPSISDEAIDGYRQGNLLVDTPKLFVLHRGNLIQIFIHEDLVVKE